MTSHVLENMSEAVTNGYSSSHQAVDVVSAGNKIDDVIAIGDGVVEMVVKDVKYTNHNTSGTATYGNFVKIKHPSGKKTLYAHLKYGSVSVSSGQAVSKGQKIGTMGATGNAYGTHLHFEVRNSNETRENPNDYLSGKLSIEPEKIEEVAVKEEEIVNDEPIVTEEVNDNPEEDVIEDNTEEINKTSNSVTINNLTSSNKVSDNETKNYDSEYDSSDEDVTILENSDYHGGSIVDGLKGIGIDSSYDNREIIALKNGITNYRGSYNQNVYLLKLLKQGKLKA